MSKLCFNCAHPRDNHFMGNGECSECRCNSAIKDWIDFQHDSVWSEIQQWKGTYEFRLSGRQTEVLYSIMMELARQIRPEGTIGACPGGDPRYVWESVINNAQKKVLE